jgi:hypothetical protein
MRYDYTSGYRNFKMAVGTCVRSNSRRRLYFHFRMWGMFLSGVLLGALVYPLATDSLIRLIAMPIAVGLIAGGSVSALLQPWQMERAYKAHNGDPKKPLHIYLEIDGDILVSGIEGKSEARLRRAAVSETAEDDEMLLLFLTKKKFLYLPKKQLPIEAVEEVRSWLRLPGGVEAC